ncbi:hypothetical protein L2E82_30092 [Cichorium intybus]|uniref:Uncharacterized protein n=1 Tax=Cichorium intybus TaxID=13427 RepID=A0ACB9CZK1_CICIN|nr:hypothetical protein L2E82_30092 [Cichorium intybus]
MHISLIYSSISNPILLFLFSTDGVLRAPTKSTSEHSRVPASTKERLQKKTSYSASPSPLFLRGFHLYPWALTKENLILLEAWKTTDGEYVVYGEQSYAATKKMLATLDDLFTRFLELGDIRDIGYSKGKTPLGKFSSRPSAKLNTSANIVEN